MIINHNLSAMFANRLLGVQDSALNRNIEQLSSGLRINKAGDDASGLAVSEKLRGQIRGLNRAVRNIEDAVAFIQTAEGYLAETQDILQRIRELTVQSANGIFTQEDRMQIQVEVSQLVDEVNRIASHAQFNGLNMLTGRFASAESGGLDNPVFFSSRSEHGSTRVSVHRHHDGRCAWAHRNSRRHDLDFDPGCSQPSDRLCGPGAYSCFEPAC